MPSKAEREKILEQLKKDGLSPEALKAVRKALTNETPPEATNEGKTAIDNLIRNLQRYQGKSLTETRRQTAQEESRYLSELIKSHRNSPDFLSIYQLNKGEIDRLIKQSRSAERTGAEIATIEAIIEGRPTEIISAKSGYVTGYRDPKTGKIYSSKSAMRKEQQAKREARTKAEKRAQAPEIADNILTNIENAIANWTPNHIVGYADEYTIAVKTAHKNMLQEALSRAIENAMATSKSKTNDPNKLEKIARRTVARRLENYANEINEIVERILYAFYDVAKTHYDPSFDLARFMTIANNSAMEFNPDDFAEIDVINGELYEQVSAEEFDTIWNG